jgi:pimeloyl-ACP methyl ester carboxylesterase
VRGTKMAIDSPEAIPAGRTTQWIRVRGADAANPVLLLIRQGPGLPMINETCRFDHLLSLEQAFTVIYWDQRGCGTQGRAGLGWSPWPDRWSWLSMPRTLAARC